MHLRAALPVLLMMMSACSPPPSGSAEGEGEGEGEGPVVDVITLAVDDARAVRVTIGPSGGSLVLDDVTLVVPAFALSEDVEIEMAPATAEELPGVTLVELRPDGLSFLAPAALRFAGVPRADGFALRFAADGSEGHLAPRGDDDDVEVMITHFSGAGAGTGPAPQFTPTAVEAAALNDIASIEIAEAAAGTIAVEARADALRPWLAEIRAQLAAITDDPIAWDRAVAAGNGLLVLVQAAGLHTDPLTSAEYGSVQSELHLAMRNALARIADDRRRAALAGGDWHLELAVEQVVAQRAQGPIDVQIGDPQLSPEALARDSLVDVVFSDVVLRPAEDSSDPNLTVEGRVVATFAGEPITDAPLTLNVFVGQGDAVGDAASGVVARDADGHFEFQVAPHVGASRVVVVLDGVFDGFQTYTPSASTSVARDILPTRLVLRAPFGTAGFVSTLPGESVQVEAVMLQADGAQETGAPGRVVTFTVAGPGSFAIPTATTNQGGVAAATFLPGDVQATSVVTASVDVDGTSLSASMQIAVAALRVSLEPTLAIVGPSVDVAVVATITGSTLAQSFGLTYGTTGGAFVSTETGVVWTAPSQAGHYQLRATSEFDPRAFAVTDMEVLGSAPVLVYEGTVEYSYVDDAQVTGPCGDAWSRGSELHVSAQVTCIGSSPQAGLSCTVTSGTAQGQSFGDSHVALDTADGDFGSTTCTGDLECPGQVCITRAQCGDVLARKCGNCGYHEVWTEGWSGSGTLDLAPLVGTTILEVGPTGPGSALQGVVSPLPSHEDATYAETFTRTITRDSNPGGCQSNGETTNQVATRGLGDIDSTTMAQTLATATATATAVSGQGEHTREVNATHHVTGTLSFELQGVVQ